MIVVVVRSIISKISVLVSYHCNFYVAFVTDSFAVLTIIIIFFILIH